MQVLLANPRGFCAGVDRAIEIVERAIALHGAPIYVRHEVVHNKFVVNDLRKKGAVFIEDLDEVPTGATLIFSAHGVSQAVRRDAESRVVERSFVLLGLRRACRPDVGHSAVVGEARGVGARFRSAATTDISPAT